MEKDFSEFNRNIGYEYKCKESGLIFYEFHIDDHESFHEKFDEMSFGGNLSVRKNEKDRPIIMIGQDEYIYKQFLLVRKQWTLPDGTTAINPKDEGMGIMLSSFVSRDFGYGFKLTPSQLKTVNEYRRGKQYIDEEAAREVLKCKYKQTLKNSPFIRKFEYGVNSDRFWNYNHMVVQFEDVVDVLKALNGNTYHFLFFFDHSASHD